MKNANISKKNKINIWLMRLLLRLPGLLILAIGIISLIPSVSQSNIVPTIGKYLLILVALLATLSPGSIWKLFHIVQAEANMFGKRKELERREQRLVLLEPVIAEVESMIKQGWVTSRLDFVIKKINWQGLEAITFPNFEVECEIASRFPLNLAFRDIHEIQFEIAIIDNIPEGKGMPWVIANKSKLTYFQNIETGYAGGPTGKQQIVRLSKTLAFFKFGWNDGYTRDKIKANYMNRAKIQLRFQPKWELTVPDGRLVNYSPPSIDGEFPIALV